MRGLMMLAATAALATPPQARLEEIDREIKACSSVHSLWCAYEQTKWGHDDMSGSGPCDRKVLDEMQAKCLKLSAERCELAPKNIGYLNYHGDALVFAGRFAEAEAAYRKSLALAKDGSYEQACAMYKVAEAQFGGGDREGAVATLKALCERRINTVRRGQTDWSRLASDAHALLTDAELDNQRLPRFTGAKAYPEPQEAKYEEAFAPCETVVVKLSGVKADDARIGLLRRKLEARGVKCEVVGFLSGLWTRGYVLDIALDPAAPVGKPEGYTLVVGEMDASIRARDAQGVLWGVVSFIQLLDPEKPQVRRCRISDWPDTARRGFLSTSMWIGTLEYMLFNKLNSVDFQRHPGNDGAFSPLNEYSMARFASRFRAFGLELYFGILNWTMDLGWPYGKPALLAIQADVCKRIAAMGAGVYYPNDDCRYTSWAEDDKKAGLAPSDIDAKHIAKLYAEVKAAYPDFRLIYCPPFYWGPDSKAAYPDDREKYLKSLRILPPEVDLYWTGPMVKGFEKKPYQTEWFTNLTGHRPTIFQNGTGPHNLIGYVVDATDWNGWHYSGFFERDIRGFHKNAHAPAECCQIATLADCLWNVKGYDKDRAARRGVNQLLGARVYDILAPALPALAYFDKYKYGALTADILHEDPKDLEAKAALAESAWQQAVAYNPAVRMFGDFGRGVAWAKNVVKGAKNPPDFLAKHKTAIADCRALAEKEVGVDPAKGDLFYSPIDLVGGQAFTQKAGGNTGCEETRFVKCLRGASTTFPQCGLRFECDPFPPAGAYELYLCGMDDELPAQNTIRICVNGKVVYEGPTGFENAGRFSVRKFAIPFETMVRYNQVTIENKTPGFNSNGTPWLFFNYAVIRKTR